MVAEAAAYPANHGLAEEIYLMQPDLVVASVYSTRATVAMLRHLGIPVIQFEPASTMEDVRARILQMGAALGRDQAAMTMVADFDSRLDDLSNEIRRRPEAILYHANGYTSGNKTLAGQILLAAGFENAAVKAGYSHGAKMPLEVLAMTAPEVVITSHPYPGSSRSEEILDHPVVRALRQSTTASAMSDQDWVCGTPYVLRAIEALGHTRRALVDSQE